MSENTDKDNCHCQRFILHCTFSVNHSMPQKIYCCIQFDLSTWPIWPLTIHIDNCDLDMLLVIQLGTFENEIHAGDIGLEVTVIQGVFLTAPPPCSVPKRKEANEPTRGFLRWRIWWNSSSDWLKNRFSFWYWKWGGPVKKNTLYEEDAPKMKYFL